MIDLATKNNEVIRYRDEGLGILTIHIECVTMNTEDGFIVCQ
jgi:hypothetical protein